MRLTESKDLQLQLLTILLGFTEASTITLSSDANVKVDTIEYPNMMSKCSTQAVLLAGLFLGSSNAANILLSNDDGWATSNIRSLFSELSPSHNVVLSAPAENKSGSSSLDLPPTPRTSPCQFDSCPANSPAIGTDPSNPRLQYVNSFPVTSVKRGISDLAPRFFPGQGNGKVDLVATGVNIGSNLDVQVPFSGTVGAAVEAAKQGISAIAFSGRSGEPTSFKAEPIPTESVLYAALASEVIEAVLAGDGLPSDVWLNVNFPDVSERCDQTSDFAFVLSRINWGILSDKDVDTCGNGGRLPTERSVVDNDNGCFVSVSVGDARDKTTAPREKQEDVVRRLGGFLSCLP